MVESLNGFMVYKIMHCSWNRICLYERVVLIGKQLLFESVNLVCRAEIRMQSVWHCNVMYLLWMVYFLLQTRSTHVVPAEQSQRFKAEYWRCRPTSQRVSFTIHPPCKHGVTKPLPPNLSHFHHANVCSKQPCVNN